MNQEIKVALLCPKCKNNLSFQSSEISCNNPQCRAVYPIINNIPILINEENSIFTINDFKNYKSTFFNYSPNIFSKLKRSFLPTITYNNISKQNYDMLLKQLRNNPNNNKKILVIGGSIDGKGFSGLKKSNFEIIETDVSFGPNTKIICDAHDIPFTSNYFDCVICQAVLEHVLDPYRVVDEIFRVLKMQGIVYVETPFMQQVHGRQYDFTRFSLLGHRRLFRRFEVISDGLLIGTGSALAWSIKYFFHSLFKNKKLRKLMENIAQLLFFWFKYFDIVTNNNESALDGASAYFFMGKKSNLIISDSELIKMYRGGL